MQLNPSSAVAQSDGSIIETFVYRSLVLSTNNQDFLDTVNNLASALLSNATPRAIVATGQSDTGFWLQYTDQSNATTGDILKTQGLAQNVSYSNLQAIYIQPADNFVTSVAGDIKNVASGFLSWLPWVAVAILAFEILEHIPRPK